MYVVRVVFIPFVFCCQKVKSKQDHVLSKDADNEEHEDKDQTDAQNNAPDQPLCLSALLRVDVEGGTRLA